MHTVSRGGFVAALAGITLMGLAAGCEKEKSQESAPADAGAQDAGPPQPVIGGKLGAAVAAAASGSAAAPQASGDPNAPPESGVFTPAAAAKALPKEIAYKIEVVSDGSEPRVKLTSQIDAKAEQKISVILGLRMGGPQGLPNLELGVSLKPEKPKDPPKEGEAAPTAVVAKVTSATLASMSLGGPPKELLEAIAKLKGSAVRYQLSPDNVMSGLNTEVAKGADPGLEPIVAALGEALGLITPPLPGKPVGAGAFWMIAERAEISGARLPVLRYRVFKLEKVEGDRLTLSVDSRQYADGPDIKLPSGNGMMTLTIDRFDSSGKGSVTWARTEAVPGVAEISQRMQALLIPPGGGQSAQRSAAQMELTATIAAPAAQ